MFQSCAFYKKSNSTHLKVVVSGAMRIYNCDYCCKRWYVTFDDKECSPIPIDGIVYLHKGKGTQNVHRPRVVRGYCKITKQGVVNIAVSVGDCANGHTPGNAYTGYASAFRIYIEEVNAPQM